MSYIVQNETVVIGNLFPMQTRNEIFSVYIIYGRDSMRPLILRYIPKSSWILCGIAWFFILTASYFRYILYSHLYRKWKNKQLTSIDLLILISSIAQHLANVGRIVFFTLLLSEVSSSEYWDWEMEHTGFVFCGAFRIIMGFEYYYSGIGSLGIAIFRVMYVKFDTMVKDVIGATNLLKIILYGGISLTAILLSSLFLNDYEQLQIKHCHTPANFNIFKILDEYEQGKGKSSIYQYFIYPRIASGGVMLLVTISELSIYIILFRFMYLHDNNERLRRLLEPNVIRQRNKTNAITLFGQFCSFVFEISIWILFILAMLMGGNNSVGLLAAFSILKTIAFTCMTVIEAMTSSSLRSKVSKNLISLRIFKK